MQKDLYSPRAPDGSRGETGLSIPAYRNSDRQPGPAQRDGVFSSNDDPSRRRVPEMPTSKPWEEDPPGRQRKPLSEPRSVPISEMAGKGEVSRPPQDAGALNRGGAPGGTRSAAGLTPKPLGEPQNLSARVQDPTLGPVPSGGAAQAEAERRRAAASDRDTAIDRAETIRPRVGTAAATSQPLAPPDSRAAPQAPSPANWMRPKVAAEDSLGDRDALAEVDRRARFDQQQSSAGSHLGNDPRLDAHPPAGPPPSGVGPRPAVAQAEAQPRPASPEKSKVHEALGVC